MATKQAKNRCQEAYTDFFFVTWIHKIVMIPADAKFSRLSICEIMIAKVAPKAVLIVLYPILNIVMYHLALSLSIIILSGLQKFSQSFDQEFSDISKYIPSSIRYRNKIKKGNLPVTFFS